MTHTTFLHFPHLSFSFRVEVVVADEMEDAVDYVEKGFLERIGAPLGRIGDGDGGTDEYFP